jgi:hypothetical protein
VWEGAGTNNVYTCKKYKNNKIKGEKKKKEWIKKSHTHKEVQFSLKNKIGNSVMIAVWMNLEDSILSEISQA